MRWSSTLVNAHGFRMTVRTILLWPDPRLSVACAPIGDVTSEIEVLAQDLLDTMYDAQGRGLAASQVGAMRRLFVMDASWKEGRPDPQVFVDPELLDASEERVSSSEGCLSIPGIITEIRRPARVKLAWTALSGSRLTQTFDGFAAICVQHELDHLNGVVTFDRLKDARRARAEAEYKALS